MKVDHEVIIARISEFDKTLSLFVKKVYIVKVRDTNSVQANLKETDDVITGTCIFGNKTIALSQEGLCSPSFSSRIGNRHY